MTREVIPGAGAAAVWNLGLWVENARQIHRASASLEAMLSRRLDIIVGRCKCLQRGLSRSQTQDLIA